MLYEHNLDDIWLTYCPECHQSSMIISHKCSQNMKVKFIGFKVTSVTEIISLTKECFYIIVNNHVASLATTTVTTFMYIIHGDGRQFPINLMFKCIPSKPNK